MNMPVDSIASLLSTDPPYANVLFTITIVYPVPQVLKPEVRARIRDAALRTFAERGFVGTTMADVARRANVATANLYRYYGNKDALFDDVVADDVVDELERIVGRRVQTFATLLTQDSVATDVADEMMSFWIAHRLEAVVVLAGAEGTRHETAARRLIRLSVDTLVDSLHPTPVSDGDRGLLESIFENTGRTLARVLIQNDTSTTIRAAVTSFWHYQIAGLTALLRHLDHAS
jgi:AcrR family transcriptional regulator